MLKTILRSSYGSTLRSFLLTIKIWLADAHSAKDGVAYWFRCHVRGLWVPFLVETKIFIRPFLQSIQLGWPSEYQVTYGTVRYDTMWQKYNARRHITIRYDTQRHDTTQDTTLHFPLQHCSTLKCTTLHYTEPNCTSLNRTALHYTTLQYTTLNWTTLHFTAQHYITLPCPVLHYTTLQHKN